MADYRLTAGGAVLRASDGACIPPDALNNDYRQYQAWRASGGAPDPVVALPQPFAPLQARQLRRALLDLGRLADVDKAIDALPEPARSQTRIDWEYDTTFRRDTPMIIQLATALGLTEQQVDEAWRAAMEL